MPNLNIFKACVVAILVLTCVQTVKAQPLRWKFASGDRFAVQMQQNLVQMTEVNGKKLTNKVDFLLKMDWQVNEINKAGYAVMDQTFSSLTVGWESTGGEKMTFDSANQKPLRGVERRISNSLMPIMQSRFSVEMSPRGEIVSVEADKATMKLLRAAPDSMEIRKLFTTDGISDTLSSSAMILPEADTQTWKDQDVIKTPQSTSTYTRTYTVAGDEQRDGKQLKKINIVGDVKFKQNLDNPARQPQTVTRNSQSGAVYFDPAAGNLVESQLDQVIATETPYRDMVLYANTTSTLTTKIKRVK